MQRREIFTSDQLQTWKEFRAYEALNVRTQRDVDGVRLRLLDANRAKPIDRQMFIEPLGAAGRRMIVVEDHCIEARVGRPRDGSVAADNSPASRSLQGAFVQLRVNGSPASAN